MNKCPYCGRETEEQKCPQCKAAIKQDKPPVKGKSKKEE